MGLLSALGGAARIDFVDARPDLLVPAARGARTSVALGPGALPAPVPRPDRARGAVPRLAAASTLVFPVALRGLIDEGFVGSDPGRG
jgi:hypothetical protein